MKRIIVLVSLTALSASLLAAGPNERAYRCGNTYSQTPCPGGKTVETADARSKDQKAQADAANTRTQRMANEMEKSRLQREQREAAQRKAALKEIDKSAAKTVAKDSKSNTTEAKPKKKTKQPENFTAKSSAEPKKKKSPGNKPGNGATAENSVNQGNASSASR
jgi:cell division septation protein DedD